MKTGRQLSDFANELKRQSDTKRDFVAPAKTLTFESGKLILENVGEFSPTDNFQQQAASWLDYPYGFWQRSKAQYPDQWQAMVNVMLHGRSDQRMVRVLDGNARAFLSNSYRRIDNWDVADTVLNAVVDKTGWEVASAEITDSRMFLKVLTPLKRDMQVGDTVQAGFVVKNSEIGLGCYEVEFLVYRLRCKNGLIAPDSGIKRSHLGARVFEGRNDVSELFSDETKRLTDRALMEQTGDIIRATADASKFEQIVAKFKAAGEEPITGNVPAVVELTGKDYRLTDGERRSVLKQLVEQGDGLNRFGMINAITATAHVLPELSYERSIELEQIGGKILELPTNAWTRLASQK